MSFETLKATINSNIVSGLPDGIRADYEHNPTLQDIVSAFGQDYIYMGSATVGTSPMTDDNARMYISSGSGEFTAFRDSGNNAINISEGEIAILKGISGVYEKDVFFSGDTVDDAGSVRINDTGSLIQLQAKYNGSWITISEFSYVGGDVTLQSVNAYNLNAGSVVIGDMVESSAHTEVNDYLCVDGEVLISQNEYLYADDFVEDRLESTSGEYIPNTASNSLAEIGMDTINDKCVLYNEAITSKEGVIESIVPSSTDGDFDVTRSSYTNRVNRDGFIEQVPPNTASYNYDSGDTRPHLLTEAASTNLITYPISFGNSYWHKSGASVEGDYSIGEEMISNGDFEDGSTGWTLGTGWTISSGIATSDGSIDLLTYNDFAPTRGKTYEVQYEITAYTSGESYLSFGGSYLEFSETTIGTFSYTITATLASNFSIYSSSFIGSIDNVSVKELKGAPAGDELVTNGGFDTDSDWSKGTGWSIGSGAASCDGTQTDWTNLIQTGVFTLDKFYIINFDVTVTSGTLRMSIQTPSTYLSEEFTTSGNKTVYAIASGTGLFVQGNTDFTGSIDNISVKEVQPFEAPKEIPVANGEELVTNGTFESGLIGTKSDGGGSVCTWTLNTTSSISGSQDGLLDLTTVSSFQSFPRLKFSTTMSVGEQYLLSFDYKVNSGTCIIKELYVGGSAINIDEELNGSGTFKYSFEALQSGEFDIYWKGLDLFTVQLDNISVKEVTSYSGGGFEREAYKLVEGTNTGLHRIDLASNITVSATTTYTQYVFAKAGERPYIGITENAQTDKYAVFDLQNGVLLEQNGTSASIEALADGWYKCSLTTVSGAVTTWDMAIYPVRSSYTTGTPAQSYTGDGTSGVYIAYAQLEESDYASSLMLPVTEGSTTTRVGDAVSNAGNSALFSGVNSSGVLYAEIAANSDEGFYRNISLNDGTTGNRISIYYSSPANNKIQVITKVGNSDQAYLNQTLNVTEFSKIGFRWAENDFSLWVDGVEVDTDTSGSTWGSGVFTTLTFSGYGSTYPFYGKTKALAVFDYLSDYEMIRLTK